MPSMVTGNLAEILIRKDKAIRAAIRQECMDSGMELKGQTEDVVRNWQHRPAFAAQPTIRPDYISVEIKVGGAYRQIFGYIDKGTGRYGKRGKAYEIKPKKKEGFLKFQTGYSAFTKPVAQYNVGTGKKFGPWVSVKSVIHPGIKPRKFLETFGEKLIPPFDQRILDAIVRAIKGV